MADAPKTAAQFFAAPAKPTPAPDAAPATSEFPGWEEVKPEAPVASAVPAGWEEVKPKGTYSIDEFKAAKDDDLTNDLDFSPKEFGADNKVALQKDPDTLQKAIRIYEAKDKRGTTLGEKAKMVVTGAPKVGKTLFETLKQVADQAEELAPMLSPVGAVKTIARIAGGGIEPEIKRKAGKAAEVGAAVELGALGSSDLVRKAGRAVSDKVTGNKDYKQRFFDDVAAAEMTRNAASANGEIAKALGTDSESLKEHGIEIDPDAVQKLSVAADPVNYIPVAGGVGFLGKAGKFLVARTVNAEQAAKLAGVLNTARKAVSSGAQLAGSALETVGGAVAKGGEALAEGVKSAGGIGTGAAVGGIAAGTIPGAAAGMAAVKTVPKILQLAGKSAESLGQLVKGARAPSALESVVGATAKGAARGAAEAAAVTFPLMIGADAQEQESLLGGVGLAGALGGAGGAAKAAGKVAHNKVLDTVYKQVERAETPESPYYGTDQALDTAHAAEISKLPANEQKVVNYFRNFLKDSGVEVYALDQDTFTGRVPNVEGAGKAKGFFTEAGEATTPTGTKPVVRIFLNGGADAVGHEIFHALESLDPKGASQLRESITSSWTPEQKAQFAEQYNTALNGGKPKELWTSSLTDKDVASEVSAEVFSRVLNATDLSGVGAPIQQRAATFLSNVLNKLGANPDVSPVRSGKNFSEIQSYIQDFSKRVNETGTMFEGGKRANPIIEPKEITTESINPAHPLGVGPKRAVNIDVAPVFKSKPKAKVEVTRKSEPAPVSRPVQIPEEAPKTNARNIRTTRGAQNDFAAKRAEVTNAAKAVESAKLLDKEVQDRVAEVNKSLETGSPVEIEHSGIKSESTSEAPSGRSARRAEQKAGYIAEGLKNAPEKIREAHQKVFVPVRWEIVGGKPQLLAMSLDKVIANVHRAVEDATKVKADKLIPYDTQKGKLTDAAWNQVVEDLKAYSNNQSHGYRGDGQRLLRPAEDIGASIPAEDTGYSPVRIAEDKADFLNLVQGISTLTAREIKGSGTPGNVKGQIIAEVNRRTPEAPARIRESDINKQTFKKSGRTVKETNPLRNKLSEAGAPVHELIEVTERINAENIKSVRQRGDLDISAPVLDTIRAGFLPDMEAFSKDVADASPEEFRKKVAGWDGGLTKQAYKVGLELQDRAQLELLKKHQTDEEGKFKSFREAGKTDDAYNSALKGQFFREAIEAATDTKSAAGRFGWRRAFPDSVPPFAESNVKTSFLPAADFDKSLDPIDKAAIRTNSGRIFTGSWHGEALTNWVDTASKGDFTEKLPAGVKTLSELLEGELPDGFVEDGFTTVSGKFLNRAQALDHAEKIKQLRPDTKKDSFRSVGVLESGELDKSRSF